MAARSLGPSGEPFPIVSFPHSVIVFKDGANVETAKEFVHFLVAEGWLTHYLDFSGERMLPSIPALLDQPFWLDTRDRHHMTAAMQAASRPRRTITPPPRAIWGTTRSTTSGFWRGRSTASRSKASARSRRSTKRSPGSSRSWRSDGTSKARPFTHLRFGAKPSFSALFGLQGALQRTLWDGMGGARVWDPLGRPRVPRCSAPAAQRARDDARSRQGQNPAIRGQAPGIGRDLHRLAGEG